MDLQRGDKIGEYRIIKKLGEGGMGEVYLALHEALNQKVVIKRLHAELSGDDEMRARFHREAEALARLNHPNIVHIHNFFEAPEGACIVMEYVEGQTFEELIEQVGLIPPARAVQLLIPVLSAMAYAHAQGVIHRDIKPANIMLVHETGEVRVLDFGTAKMSDRPGLTRAGMTLGTATYMAPEQLLGKPLTPAADIYALGVTLYEMCTGRLPFESDNTADLVRKVLREEPVSPRVYYPLIPERLEQIILRCLAKKPEERYRDVHELEQEMRDLLKQLAAQTIMGLKPAAPRKPTEYEAATQGLGAGEANVRVDAVVPSKTNEQRPERPKGVGAPAPARAPRSTAPPTRLASVEPTAAVKPARSPDTGARLLGFQGALWTLAFSGVALLVAGSGVLGLTLGYETLGLVAAALGATTWLALTGLLALSVVQLDERREQLEQRLLEARTQLAETNETLERLRASANTTQGAAISAAWPSSAPLAPVYPAWGSMPPAAGYGYPWAGAELAPTPAAQPWPAPAAGVAPDRRTRLISKRHEAWRHRRVEPEALSPEQIAELGGGSGPLPVDAQNSGALEANSEAEAAQP